MANLTVRERTPWFSLGMRLGRLQILSEHNDEYKHTINQECHTQNKAGMSKSEVKIIDVNGVIYSESVPPNQPS